MNIIKKIIIYYLNKLNININDNKLYKSILQEYKNYDNNKLIEYLNILFDNKIIMTNILYIMKN